MGDEKYLKSLQINKEKTLDYYKKSLNKTYQQIFLEEEILPKLLPADFKPQIIADIACGGGTFTYHISKIFPDSKFILSDLNSDGIEMAKKINSHLHNIEFKLEDFLNTSISPSSVDFVFSGHTLFILSNPRKFLLKIIEILKPGGYFILSSLFNIYHDVDLFTKIKDHTRKGNILINYNTISKKTIEKWIKNKCNYFDIFPFDIQADLPEMHKGLGSYTLKLENGKRITISGGLLMNWGFLCGKK